MTKLSRDVSRLVERRGAMRARDGAVIDPVVDEANGVQWFFKYRKNSIGKYKWYAQGMQEYLVGSNASVITPTPVSTFVAATNAIVTLPFSGFYFPRLFATWGTSGSPSTVSAGLFLDGALVGPIDQFNKTIDSPSSDFTDAEYLAREGVAQHVWGIALMCSVIGPTSSGQVLKVRPQRVSI